MRHLKSLAVALGLGFAVASPAAAELSGGGMVMNVNAGCAAAGLMAGRSVPVRLRYSPAVSASDWTEVQVNFGNGVEHLNIYGPLLPTNTNFQQGFGYSVWSYFQIYAQRPRLQMGVLNVIAPAQAQLAQATEVELRLNVRNFANLSGCNVTVTGLVSR